ncbi:hypothetical protein LZ31DRAFT_510564 [Colletotrichum somersetense]|nr:hypothetical protein LZ31DRAFT_510564 [Colletotrichum somersetense]
MEENHNFKATVQMYKKRFAKWGFHKNVRCGLQARGVNSRLSPDLRPLPTAPSASVRMVPAIFHLSVSDSAQMAFLFSIRAWTASFFERDTNGKANLYPLSSSLSQLLSVKPQTRDLDNPEQLRFAFKVILALLNRNEGALAGRLARKAFLQAEALVDAEGPLFIWNTLEIFHNIALLGQANLGHTLSHHLTSLAGDRPASGILLRLRALLQAWQWDGVPVRLDALERAWAINADLTFSRFDPEYLLLFYQLVWDSDVVKLDSEVTRHSEKWFARIHDRVNRTLYEDSVETATEKLWSKHELISDETDLHYDSISRPANFNQLKQEGLAGVSEILSKVPADSPMRVRVLSAFLKSQVLQNDAATPVYTGMNIPRFQARIMAYIFRIILDVKVQGRESVCCALDRMKTILALRESGQGRSNSRTVYEMWQLEDLLICAGRVDDATELRAESYRRLAELLTDIPEQPHDYAM